MIKMNKLNNIDKLNKPPLNLKMKSEVNQFFRKKKFIIADELLMQLFVWCNFNRDMTS